MVPLNVRALYCLQDRNTTGTVFGGQLLVYGTSISEDVATAHAGACLGLKMRKELRKGHSCSHCTNMPAGGLRSQSWSFPVAFDASTNSSRPGSRQNFDYLDVSNTQHVAQDLLLSLALPGGPCNLLQLYDVAFISLAPLDCPLLLEGHVAYTQGPLVSSPCP